MNDGAADFGSALAWTIVLALVLGVGSYLIGLPPSLAAVVAAGTMIVGAALALTGRVRDGRLPDVQLDLRHGTRREIQQLSWTAGGARNRLNEPVVRRLREVAVARLAAHGIDLDDPAQQPRAEALLGRSAYRVLSRPAGQSAAVLLRCIAALDALDRTERTAFPGTAASGTAASRTETAAPGRTP